MSLFKQSSKFPLAIIIVSFFLTACGGGGGGSAQPVSDASASALSAERQYAAERIYRDERFPVDFTFPEFWDDSPNIITAHVKSTEVLLFAKMPEIPAFELSTDSWKDAITWSEEAAQKLPVYYDLVDLRETDMYFELIRVNSELPDMHYHSLIFKDSFIDRSGVDLDNPGAHRGYISLNFLTSGYIDTVVEHLYLSSGHNQYGYAVLEEGTEELDEEFRHTMTEAELVPGAGSCDTIRVFEIVHHISKITGEMTAETRDLYDFRAVVDAEGNITACGGRV
jgi:hypothetical protein